MRRAWFLSGLVLVVACGGGQQRAEQHFRNELSFFSPYVDIEAEERAVTRVLAQRKLVVDERVRGTGFVALSASSLDQVKSAVRIVTKRGVVAAADADSEDWLALRKVALLSVATDPGAPERLLGILKTARHRELGCAELLRVLADGRVAQVQPRIQRFGTRACVANLKPAQEGEGFTATVAWPGLSAGVTPTLDVDLVPQTARLDQPSSAELSLQVVEAGAWIAREAARLAQPLEARAPFAQCHAHGVARAALALAENRSREAQLAAYRSAVAGATAGATEAELMAEATFHIEHGWDDPQAPSGDDPSSDAGGPEAPLDLEQNVVIDPVAAP